MNLDETPWILMTAKQRRREAREHKRRFVRSYETERERRWALRHLIHWHKEPPLSRTERRRCRESWAKHRREFGPDFVTPSGRSFPKHCRYYGGKEVPCQIRTIRNP